MKIKKISPCLIAVSGLSMALAGCQSEEQLAGNVEGKSLPVEVTVTVPTEETRTSLTELNGNLVWEWQEGDQLLVTSASGANVGTLTVKDIKENNPASATFTGNINGLAAGKQSLTFHYLGKGQSPAAHRNNYAMSIAEQSGDKNDLVKYDVLSTTLAVDVNANYINIPDFSMSHYFAAGHFTLHFSDDRTLSGETVTVSGDNLYNTANIDLGKTGFTSTAGDIVVTNGTGDFYINLIPGNSVQMNFSVVTEDGIEWTGSFPNVFNIEATRFYRSSATLGGLVIEMKPDMDPSNPGNMGNWGGEVPYPGLKEYPLSKIGLSKDAWTHNFYTDVDEDFGYAAPLEYAYNAIKGNHLTSNSWTDGGEAKYFQWGRWLGFPMNVVYAQVNGGFGFAWQAESMVRYARGTNANKHYQLYYCWDMDSRHCYAYCTDTNWGKQQAINSSIIFGVNQNDYLSTNENCKWEDRSGNPCPDGFRLPSMDEMEVFVPSAESISGTYAEVKNVDGVKFAVKWTVSATSVYVQSVKTNKTTVKANDPIFENAKGVTLIANGMLYCDYPNSISDSPSAKFATSFDGGWKTGGYWTSDSHAWADGGYAGVALMIRIKNGVCKMGLETVERTAGLCVMPFRDASKKATPLRPWFPLGIWI